MRIAVIEPVGSGGLIHYAFQLCRAFASAGAETTLITQTEYELENLPHDFNVEKRFRLWDAKEASGIRGMARGVRRLSRAFRWYWEWLRVIRYVRREKFDLVQLGDLRFPTDVFFVALLRMTVPLLTDICHNVARFSHASGTFGDSRLSRFLYRRAYRRFDMVFVHFQRNRYEFMSVFGIDPRRVTAIVHGNEELFEELENPTVDGATLRRALQLPENARVILMFGTLSRYKGLDLLIEAFAQVRRRLSRAHLVLAGYPSPDLDLRELRAHAEELGVSDSVDVFADYIPSDRVAAWMGLADIAVFPYHSVWQSGAVQTAATFGLPIVATRVGAIEDEISDEITGLLVPPGDSAALAEAILRVLQDSVLAVRLGTTAYSEARERFGWDGVAATILNAYGVLAPARTEEQHREVA
jgi:glycosyltransferase involved in cell wall biosynthesis